ncbi:TetR/AcrR family transcriptional regulator [Streptomyces sp. SPB162]|uniref:TetR/AcrR family transcriptional regulator n=1 Tax=Streptomyces sp. SPB162 TaxID=2940560 RepID=UPI0024056788|nr:TetR/AcrR family transcriptional regulator [Streptomyces sp. SPB162]MDF9811021.1 AcrR family transcriptional regulator [Streptomyces sp. SPB162]
MRRSLAYVQFSLHMASSDSGGSAVVPWGERRPDFRLILKGVVVTGRPRGVHDSAILRTTAEVIGRVGPSGLTLAVVAREVGMVPATLVQRFGSKRGLLLALAEQSAKDAVALFGRARSARETALQALVTLTVESMRSMSSPEAYANHMAFLCVDLTDPEFHRHALAVHQAQRQAVEDLLTEAVSTGALRAGTDVTTLTRSVQAAAAGTGLMWALDRQGTLAERLRQAIDTALSSHQPTSRQVDCSQT